MSEFPSTPEQLSGFQEPAPPPVARVRRSRRDRVIGGVCGGLGRYLRIDPVLLRIAAVALALSGGLGVVAYLIAWIVIPEERGTEPVRLASPDNRHGIAVAVGAALVGLGVLLLARGWIPWIGAEYFWPIVVVAIGVVVIASANRR